MITLHRRNLLKIMALTAVAPMALLGCGSAIPPNEYKRPRSYIRGGSGKRSRIGGGK